MKGSDVFGHLQDGTNYEILKTMLPKLRPEFLLSKKIFTDVEMSDFFVDVLSNYHIKQIKECKGYVSMTTFEKFFSRTLPGSVNVLYSSVVLTVRTSTLEIVTVEIRKPLIKKSVTTRTVYTEGSFEIKNQKFGWDSRKIWEREYQKILVRSMDDNSMSF